MVNAFQSSMPYVAALVCTPSSSHLLLTTCNPMLFKKAISKAKISGFPAENEGFIEALCNWDEEQQPENTFFDNTFSLTDSYLCKLVRENGAARALACMSMKTAIFTALFGIQEDRLVWKAVPLSSCSPGFFG